MIRTLFIILMIINIAYAEVKIGKNREFILNGKPFFPLAVTTQPTLTMDLHKSLGINQISGGPGAKGEDPKFWIDTCVSKGFVFDLDGEDYETMKKYKDNPGLLCYWLPDEPDNNTDKKSPKNTPAEIMAIYKKIKAIDSNHPVGICFGSSFAAGNPMSPGKFYPEYMKACDYAITDIYPVNRKEYGPKKLYVYKKGMSQLNKFSKGAIPHGIAVEASFLGAEGGRNAEGTRAPNATELRAEVWMSIVYGAKAIYYFTHSWSPGYHWARIPDDLQAEMKSLNKNITDLAPVILSEESKVVVTIDAAKDSNVDIGSMVRETPEKLYIFASNIKYEKGAADFAITGYKSGEVEVYDEKRKINMSNGKFSDRFKEFEPHIYVISKK